MVDRTQPTLAQDRLTFLLSLVPFLMDRSRVSVAATARHFSVSPEYVREAIRMIWVSGVPGETATYQHGDLFDFSEDSFRNDDEIVLTNLVAIDESPRFSARETAALIAGLQYLSVLPEYSDRKVTTTLMSKLSLGASAAPSPVAVEPAEKNSTLIVVRNCVEQGVRLEFAYRNSRGQTERRIVDPLRLESTDADWYLRGWDHAREAVRLFRLDRMSDLVVTDDAVTTAARGAVFPENLFEASSDDLVVTIDVAIAALPLLVDYMPEIIMGSESDGRVRTTIRVAHYHGLKRLIASMPGAATVIQPGEARAATANWAQAAAARYC
ncbi:MAG: helix-turn-helix transcriptional regulator [Rhodoglobus sp.]